MNPAVAGLVTRLLGGMIAGWLVSKGYADADTATSIAGGVVAAGIGGWSYVQKRNAGLVGR